MKLSEIGTYEWMGDVLSLTRCSVVTRRHQG